MRKLMLAAAILIFGIPASSSAQDDDRNTTQEVKHGVKKSVKGVKKGVKMGVHEVAEQASEAKSDISRTELEGKTGPNGQDIFIEKDGTYYYIDDKGRKVYISASDLRDKPAKLEDD